MRSYFDRLLALAGSEVRLGPADSRQRKNAYSYEDEHLRSLQERTERRP